MTLKKFVDWCSRVHRDWRKRWFHTSNCNSYWMPWWDTNWFVMHRRKFEGAIWIGSHSKENVSFIFSVKKSLALVWPRVTATYKHFEAIRSIEQQMDPSHLFTKTTMIKIGTLVVTIQAGFREKPGSGFWKLNCPDLILEIFVRLAENRRNFIRGKLLEVSWILWNR